MRGLLPRIITILGVSASLVAGPIVEARAEGSLNGWTPERPVQLQETGGELSSVRGVIVADERAADARRAIWDPPRAAPRGYRPRGGSRVFHLAIPRLRLSEPVREGAGSGVLGRGLGHYPACRPGFPPPYCAPFPAVWPGEKGRTIVGGHRSISPSPFARLGRLRPGDRIEVRAPWGQFLYRVHHLSIVEPWDRTIIVPGIDRHELVLVTCHPPGSARKRLLVFARLAQPSR
jgi:LPXTG-site transpeptidase (sortase) family protein